MNNIIYKDGKYKLLKTEDIYKLENLAKKSDIKRSRYCGCSYKIFYSKNRFSSL